jgi:hypothetical protein
MFSIMFIQDSLQRQGNNTQVGEIIIGEFREVFHSSLSYWNQQQYLNQWREGINRICMGEANSSLITDMYDPNSSNIVQWWVLRCDNDLVRVRNELVFLEDLKQPFIEEDIYKHIEERPAVNKKGKKISQWEVNISDIHDFYWKILDIPMLDDS